MLGQEPAGALPREGPLIDTELVGSSRSTTKGSLRLPFVAWPLVALTLTAAAGCADVSGQALQQDVAQIRQDLNSLTLAVHRGRGDTETVVGQLDRRTREQHAERHREPRRRGDDAEHAPPHAVGHALEEDGVDHRVQGTGGQPRDPDRCEQHAQRREECGDRVPDGDTVSILPAVAGG